MSDRKIYASEQYVDEKISASNTVQYIQQELTEDQQMQARANLDLYHLVQTPTLIASWNYYAEFLCEDYEKIKTSRVVIEISGVGDYETNLQKCQARIPMVGEDTVYYHGNGNLLNSISLGQIGSITETQYNDIPFVVYYIKYDMSDPSEESAGIIFDDTIIDTRNTEVYVYDLINLTTSTHTVPEEYIPDSIARKEDIPEAQIQADWNQNNETQLNYIKNRPFYTISDGEYILEPTTLTFNANSNYANETLEIEDNDVYTNMFTVGNTVYIAWDGVIYSALVQTHNMMGTCIGYVPENYGGSGSDEPFTITRSMAPNCIDINRRNESVDELSVSFAILTSDTIPEYVQIDKKYLPVMIGAQFEANGESGVVPKPIAGDQNKVLRGDGTWDVISQSDWNQNDPDAEDYIKNRPFYSAYGIDYKIDKKYMPEEINNIGYTEYIEPEDVSPTLLASESIPNVEDIIGSITLAPSEDFGDSQNIITSEMITEYDWGFDFTDGFVVKNAPAIIDGETYENTGVYLRTYAYTTTTSGVDYSRYGMEIHYKYKELYIPNSIARTEDIASNYYTKEQIDNMEFITVEDIDTICGVSITNASEVLF